MKSSSKSTWTTKRVQLLAVVIALGLVLYATSQFQHAANDATPPDSAMVTSLQSSAEKGDASSQYNLGVLYYSGNGVPQDYAKAAQYFRKSAQQGNPHSAYSLGNLYINGQGVPQDYATAIYWYRQGAERGDSDSQLALGLNYIEGKGVEKNYSEAYFWLSLSDKAGNTNADKPRDEAATHLTPEQLAEQDARAGSWQAKS